ncbi:two-partner secretion domain-containing protein [Basfia succiniciproducens]|uniref:Filamentous hemagglutinin n=1 Tax=Basfia succiniciproducens TaxID=653940 RepID=A0A1G5ADH4_9PAST|nr:hemagglutinin repeat-containing protein [Basfia succiniciproducens]QIM68527.1 hypothetical protein A4G13_03540 [Basfia succiniciproducens]SCX75940.1 filamentous hemagglutinin [Basfia succiniciproducens]
MNKRCYRIIFSKTLNCLVVVSELAKTAGKAVAEFSNKLLPMRFFRQKTPDFSLHFAAFICFIGLGIIYVPQAMAKPLEIHADRSAPSGNQPTVLRTANGIPQVDIQTPSAGGVSRNVYSQFDVAEKGTVLNNARKSTNSQLAGWVTANPNLVRGEAKVILNEVNSKDPSQLKGYVEVAGKKADVIIANPSGLHCDGCGVINAGRTTLTTGQVELENGNVKGFNVRGGKVEVAGKGMDTSRVDYTDIVAGKVKVDGGIWAKELKVTTGKNKVDRTNSKVVYVGNDSTAPSSSENMDKQPIAYAVDVSELGGMYANQIHLVATEQGVGVNNAGKIGASAGNVHIDSNGKITNSGYLDAQQDIAVTANNNIENKGSIYTQQGDIKLKGRDISQQGNIIAKGAAQKKGRVQITANRDIQQSGDTLAENYIDYQAKNIKVTNNATIVAGLDFTQNTLADKSEAGKNARFNAEKSAVINGKILSSNRTEIKAADINLTNSQLHSNHLSATASVGSIIASDSNIYTEKSAVFSTPVSLVTQNAQLNAGHISINATQADNTQGTWINRDEQDLNLNLQRGLTNTRGQIATNGQLLFNGEQIDNQAGLISADSYQISAATFGNAKGKLIQQGVNPFNLTVSGTLTNDKGVIGYQMQNLNTANNSMESPVHSDNVSTNTAENITANTSTSEKPIHSGTDAIDVSDKIINIVSNVNVTEKLNNTDGYILSGSQTVLRGEGKLSNDSGTLNLSEFTWESNKNINNQLGLISALNILSLHAAELNNNQGTIRSGKNILLSTHALSNNDGLIQSGGNVTINTHGYNLDNSNTLSSNGNKGIVTSGELNLSNINQLNNEQGYIVSTQAQRIQTEKLNNTRGTLATNNTQSLKVTGTLQNQDGNLYSGQLTLDSNLLINRKGNITAASALDITVKGALDNTQGIIAAKENSVIQVATLDNQNGLIGIEQGKLNLTAATRLTNQRGQIISQGDLRLTGGDLQNNQSSTIKSLAKLTVNTGNQQINNQQGTLSSAGELTIQSGYLDNRQGLIYAQKSLFVDTHNQNLDNRNSGTKGILSLSDIILQNIGQLNNSRGQIQAQQDFSVNADTINNTGNGLLYSNTDLSLKAKSLDNRQGTVQALGNVTFDRFSTVNNSVEKNKSGSLIQAGRALTVSALNIDNQNTKTAETVPTQGLVGQAVVLSSDAVNNRQGGIYAAQILSANIKNLINNQKGEILSGGTLNAVGSALKIQNSEGVIASVGKLAIDAAQISDIGKIQSKNDADIALKQDLTLNGGIEVEGSLKLKTNNLTNDGSLLTGKGLHIQTGKLINNEKAILSSGTTLLNVNSITNYGLINGSNTSLKTTDLNNLGTGRIYGDQLSIQARELNNFELNGKSATIAARKRLDLGVGTLTNRNDSSLISLGEIHIGGTLDSRGYATGKATAVYNPNGLIEAQDNIYINSGLVSNTHNYFRTALKLISQETVTEYQGSGDPTIYEEGTPGLYVFNHESDHLHVPTGAYYESWYKYHYLKSVQRTEVLPAEYEPGRIYSGKNITIRGDRVDNINSRIIAGGKLDIPANILNNKEETGVEIVTKAGCAEGSRSEACRNLPAELRGYGDDVSLRKHNNNSPYGLHSYWRHHEKGRDSTGHSRQDYTPPQEIKEGIPLEVAAYKEYSLPSFGKANISAINVPQSIDVQVKSAVQNEKEFKPSSLSSDIAITEQDVTVNNQTTGSIVKDNAVVRTQNRAIALPRSSLFMVNPQSGSGYLVETDPAFTQYRNWLSSAYMMNALNLDSASMHKRIGDGFYEQRLVQEQIAELTGRVYLSGYSNQEEQYKALMINGITAASQFQLTPGMALTGEQIARLTSDIVWLVNKTVTLADGSTATVLYPQVYVVVQKGDINGYGALLSGDITAIQSSEMTNSGTLAGKNLLAISAENITNRFGKMTADNTLVSAEQDLVNIGGTIEAAQILNVNAGRDIVVNTTAHRTQNASGETVTLGTRGGFYLTGKDGRQMWVNAGRDINLTAGEIINNAQNALTAIQAGRDILLNVEQQSDRYENIRDAENYLKTANRRDIGTTISSQGSGKTALQAGRNIEAKAAAVSAGGDVLLNAGNNVTLSSGEEYHYVDSAFKDTGRGFLNKTTTKTRDISEQTFAIGSQLDGNNVDIFTQQGDVNIIGSDVVAENELNVAAKNINIAAATNQVYSENLKQVKKSGLMGSGGIGFTIGSRSQKHVYGENTITQSDARSTVGSVNGNVSMTAENHVNIQGSDVIAQTDKSIDIIGKSLTVEAGRDVIDSTETHEYKKSGLTVSLSTPVTDMALNARNSLRRSKEVKNERLSNLYQVKAAQEAVMAAQAAGSTIDSINALIGDDQMVEGDVSNPSFKISIGVGSSQSKQTSHSQQISYSGSELSAGNINLKSSAGDINLFGSTINATKAVLDSANNINLLSLQDSYRNRSDNENSGWNAGVFVGMNGNSFGIGIEGSAQSGKGRENTDTVTQKNSYINVRQAVIRSGRDTNLKGAVINAERLTADIGGNLLIESRQDSNVYNSEQSQSGANFAVAVYGTGTNVNVNASMDKAKLNYAQVEEQSGFKVGRDGMDINVRGNTHLKGGLIESEAAANKNRFSTNTLTTEDIENHSEVSVQSVSGGLSTNMMANAVNAMRAAISVLGTANKDDHSTTQSAVSGNIDLNIKNGEKPTALSQDTMNANKQVNRYDIEEYKEKAELAQVIGEIGHNGITIVLQPKLDKAQQEKDEAEAILKNPNSTAGERREAQIQFNQAQTTLNQYGKGGDIQMAIRAVTGVLQGIAGGDVNAAIVNGLSPYANLAVKEATTDSLTGEVNLVANLMAHAVLGAIEAQITGNNAIAGAAGAVTAEATATLLAKSLYDVGKADSGGRIRTVNDLTEYEKDSLLVLSQVAAGITGGVIGDSTQSAVVSGDIGKRAAENNYLSQLSDNRRIWLREQLNRDDLSSVQREKYEQEFIQLEQDNHTSDILVAKAKYNPESMTQSDWELYQNYATRYYFESIRTEKPENVIADLDNILSNQYIKGYSYPYATAEKYRNELPSRWSLFGTNKSADEQFYTDIYSKYQNRKTYQESFDGRVAQSTAEALGYASTMMSAGTVASVASTVGKFTSNGINKASSAIGAFAAKYPNISGAISDGMISSGVHVGYKLSTGQDVNEYEVLGAFAGGALTRNHTLGNQIRINIGVATVSSLSKDPSGNSLGNDYFGAIVAPIINKPFSTKDSTLGNIVGGSLGEYGGDLDNRVKDYKEVKKILSDGEYSK